MSAGTTDVARLDKWMWAVRLAKTRAIAAEQCAAGKVKRNGKPLKPAAKLAVGDLLEIPYHDGPGVRRIVVRSVIQKRVGAPEAQACYEERTPEEVAALRRDWQDARRQAPKGRPTKRERRDIERMRDRASE